MLSPLLWILCFCIVILRLALATRSLFHYQHDKQYNYSTDSLILPLASLP